MNIEIKNCNNIDSAAISIVKNKLNIKFAPNGTGKSTIAKIILGDKDAVVNSEETEPISMLSQYLTWCPTRSVGLALEIIIRILNNVPERFSRGLEEATHGRLTRLFDDTKYDSDNPDLNFDEKLEVRRFSSILAAVLWTYYSSKSSSVPEVVEKWREICLSPDEFSEIKKAWSNCP